MTPIDKVIARIAAGLLGILKVIPVLRTWTKEVAMARVIEFHIPNNFRQPMKWVAQVQRGKILEFCPPTRKSA